MSDPLGGHAQAEVQFDFLGQRTAEQKDSVLLGRLEEISEEFVLGLGNLVALTLGELVGKTLVQPAVKLEGETGALFENPRACLRDSLKGFRKG